MIAVDTNLLVYAFRVEYAGHVRAKQLLEAQLSSGNTTALPWPCLHEFFRVVTDARLFQPATTPERALTFLHALLAAPRVQAIAESARHLDHLATLVRASTLTGAAIHDAKIAAICLAHGVTELWSADRDFARFPGLRVRNPMVDGD